jgi:RNA-directed DNA polymerase
MGSPEAVGGGYTWSMKRQLVHKFEDIISVENLLEAWKEFLPGKRNKPDVQLFASALIDNILELHNDLVNRTYKHGGYYQFKISDPKPRDISKASVRDRLLHHAIYRVLYPFFDRIFMADSYSCRMDKGTHKAINRFKSMFYKVSKNNTKTCWVLKCDIRKFFANIDHEILLRILKEYIPDQEIISLVSEIVGSFKPGLPLGNLTSQLLVNIYMNEFDQFVKHKLKAKYYIRYADDFIVLQPDKKALAVLLYRITVFLKDQLKLTLHPDKVFIKTFASGVDFLGWINFPYHRVLRTATKQRMINRLKTNQSSQTQQSYLGLLKHGNTHKLTQTDYFAKLF